jgi:hypothetical protein
MTRFVVLVLLTAMTALGTHVSSPSVNTDQVPQVTFNKDILPILQKNCQTCHRPGEVAPMSFLTYESTRPWAKAIKAAVLSKKMPPWLADPQYGAFRNAPQLTETDIKTLATWADSGAREGDPQDKPAPIQWVSGWRIKPDVVVSMAEPYLIPAKGVGEVQQFVLPSPFKEDTWVTSIEVRPSNPSVVHHVIVQIPEERSGSFPGKVLCAADCQNQAFVVEAAALKTAKLAAGQAAAAQKAVLVRGGGDQQVPFPNGGSYADMLVKMKERMTGEGSFTTMEAVYAPGSPPLDYRFHNSAKLIKGGQHIRIEVHYTPNGRATTDQTHVGFTLAKAPAQRRFVMMAPASLVDTRKPIPAGQSSWETTGELTFKQDAELVWFMPHMHLRGKDMTFRLVYPDGRQETVLSARFDFQWQLGYEVEKPIKVPQGTKMIVTAHHDNSANNPHNPEPGRPVGWGEMTSQEMMLPWFGVVVNHDANPEMIASYRPGDFDANRPAPPQFNMKVNGAAVVDDARRVRIQTPEVLVHPDE